MASIISAGTTSGTALNMAGDTSGVLQLATNGSTTALTIDTSQNVGIGITSPSANLHISKAGGVIVKLGTSLNTSEIEARESGAANLLVFSANNSVDGMIIDANNNLQFNNGYGSVATAYGCRAWVNFNGTGTVAIRASGNVSSITDNGTGNYTANFTTAMPDVNYGLSSGQSAGDTTRNNVILRDLTTASVRVTTNRMDDSAPQDTSIVCFSIFR
jgi:hypothetical protein